MTRPLFTHSDKWKMENKTIYFRSIIHQAVPMVHLVRGIFRCCDISCGSWQQKALLVNISDLSEFCLPSISGLAVVWQSRVSPVTRSGPQLVSAELPAGDTGQWAERRMVDTWTLELSMGLRKKCPEKAPTCFGCFNIVKRCSLVSKDP